jgi:hypothetical protein
MTNSVIGFVLLLLSTFSEIAHCARLVDFYKSVISPLRSGQLPEDKLFETKLQTKIDQWVNIESDGKRFWLNKSNLFSNSLFSHAFYGNKAFTLDSTDLFSYQDAYQDNKLNKKIKPHWVKSMTLPPETTVHIQDMEGSWVKLSYQGKSFFAKNENLFFAIDLAEHFLSTDGYGHEFDNRIGDRIISKEQEKFTWKQIKKFDLRKVDQGTNWGLLNRTVIDPISGNIVFKKFQKVKVLAYKNIKWIQSLDPEQGLIWWKKDLNFHGLPSTEEISIDKLALTKRHIKSVVESDRTSFHVQLASASGIFLSQDGKSWKWLSQFSTDDRPIAISKEQTLIVGDKYSKNLGGSFEDYIRWDDLVRQTRKLLGRPPRYIKIARVQLPTGSEKNIELYIDTGIDLLKFKTSIKD